MATAGVAWTVMTASGRIVSSRRAKRAVPTRVMPKDSGDSGPIRSPMP